MEKRFCIYGFLTGSPIVGGLSAIRKLSQRPVVTNRACKSGDLSANRRGSEGDVAASQRTSQADGGQAIKAIRTLDVHRATYRNAGLSDTAGNRRRGHLRR